jgi:spore germination protein YaaH
VTILRRTLLLAAIAVLARPVRAQSVERLFYYVDRESAYNSLVRHIDRIDVLGPQVYTVDSLGVVWGSLDRRVLALAKAHGVKVMPLVVNEGFEGNALHRLLADSAARARAVRSMVALCDAGGYWGIQFDIEGLGIRDRDAFTRWYQEAADALHARGYKISLAVVHRIEEEAGPTSYGRFMQESWRAGYDLAALGRIGDFVSLMTYDQHTRRTPPGPGAGIPWMREAIDYALRYVPAAKLSGGIPLYGGHWFAQGDASSDRARTTRETVNWTWGSGLVERAGGTMQWDEREQVPFAHFERGGVYEWVFLENARSFRAKLALVRERKLRGFSAWVLGTEDEGIWEEVKR